MSHKNLLEELASYVPERDPYLTLQSKGTASLSAVSNILNYIDNTFSLEDAVELKRKYFLSIKDGNPTKFNKALQRIKDRK
jgi:hypothetical protein